LFSFQSIKDYHSLLQSNQTSCVEAVHFYLQQIQSHTHLNAFIEVYAEEALQKAALLDQQRKAGHSMKKLHGVVVGIKDVLSYKNHRLTASSHILQNFTAVYNATAIERLLQEEAIIIGRQNCDEFAMGSSNEHSVYGAVKNALDESRVPGGSSGGSAVSVQANLCMISLGSDTGGSVRQPADFCGIVGLKPSYGRVSRYGLIAYASSFDQIGIFSHSVEDAALTLEVIAGKDSFDSTLSSVSVPAYSNELQIAAEPPPKIAWFRQMVEHAGLDPEIAASFRHFIKKLTEQGIDVQVIDFELFDYIVPTYYILTTAEASSNLSRYDGVRFGLREKGNNELSSMYKSTRSKGFGKEVKRRILLGTFVLSSGYYDAYFTKAQKVRNILRQQTEQIFQTFDAIICPTVPATAFQLGEKANPIEMYLADIYTVYANLTGIPAISLPLFTHSNGMPFGLQVLTSSMNELTLLRLSKYLMNLKNESA
jgi:aspartyl-tRNA(Asn)/glutamyl-tRNA(Gln) amidotransferase subunit A